MTQKKAVLRAIRSYLPKTKLTNAQLNQQFPDWNVEKIYSKTGISSRSIASPEECASDLGVRAAQKLFADDVCRPENIECLILCTQSPDYVLPATSCIMQDRLGLRTSCGAFDINHGCSGYIYGLSVAKGLIETGTVNNVLFITADTYSKYLNVQDRSVRTLFGDGASATLLESVEARTELIGPFEFGTDGAGKRALIVPAGGCRQKRTSGIAEEHEDESGNVPSGENLFMDGAEVFGFTLKMVPPLVKTLLAKAEIEEEDVDFFVFHQANKFLLENLRRKTKIPHSKFCINMEDYGNTVSSTIPMALCVATLEQQVQPGQRIMLVGFGVGYSWGAAMVQIGRSFDVEDFR